MLKLASILCPVDFSEFTERAYGYAHSLARHYEAKLILQHVNEFALAMYGASISPEVIQDAYALQQATVEDRMRNLAGKHPVDKIAVETVVQLGSAADLIVALAEERNVDLITMGTHGRRGFDRLMLGSTFERVLRTTRCPVLGVHEPVRSFTTPGGVELHRILWCTDFSDLSPRALEFALSLAFEYQAEITLLHVLESGGRIEQERQAMERLEGAIPDEAKTWARAIPLVLTGEPYQKIIEYAAQTQADLIVMGVRGRNIVDRAIFGSTTQRVVQLGPCPVLTVRS